MIDTYFYDPLPTAKSKRRSWEKLLGGAVRECQWDKKTKAFCHSQGRIADGVIVAHHSALDLKGIYLEKLGAFCRLTPGVTVIVVSGRGSSESSILGNLYYRQSPLGESEVDPFGRGVNDFLAELHRSGQRVFDLLEFAGKGSDHLIALDILCQGFLFAHGQGTPEGYGVPFPVSEEMREKTARADWWTGGLEMADPAQLDGLLRGQGLPADRAGAIAGFLASALQETLPARTAAVRRLQAEVREALR